ncbi:MAG: hypothetical protein F4X58_11950 [Chloroflexi bacterium]|nr:hypothetical protein [Chloroflexota bacterium]MYC02623.1 hypothetical protein [Chloroflexota bacterium]
MNMVVAGSSAIRCSSCSLGARSLFR